MNDELNKAYLNRPAPIEFPNETYAVLIINETELNLSMPDR